MGRPHPGNRDSPVSSSRDPGSPDHPDSGTRPWRQAWQQALYGDGGFYRRPEGPAGHFRTAVHAAPEVLAAALARLARAAGCTRVVDVGAGRGELLTALVRLEAGPAAPDDPGLDLLGVDVVPRPAGLPARADWSRHVPSRLHDTLLVGWELLDVVPCEIAEVDASGTPRVVDVDREGRERLGAELADDDLAWCQRWWPGPWAPGCRLEVGRSRDAHWRRTTSSLVTGVAVAVDYDHHRAARPAAGTLTGFRAGRQVRARPDGTTDLTAHVALDAVAAALSADEVSRAGDEVALMRQHEALGRLGVRSSRPPMTAATSDPPGYLRRLAEAGLTAELLERGGLGGFGWLFLARGDKAAAVVRSWRDPTRPEGARA